MATLITILTDTATDKGPVLDKGCYSSTLSGEDVEKIIDFIEEMIRQNDERR